MFLLKNWNPGHCFIRRCTAVNGRIALEGVDTDADIFMTVDVKSVAMQIKNTSPVESEVLSSRIPQHLRDIDNQWFGFSKRARTIVYSKTDIDPQDLAHTKR